MTAVIAAAAANRLVVMTGWTLVVILWETTALGVLLASWRLLHPRSPAQRRYMAAIVVFAAAVVLAAVTPLALIAGAPSPSAPKRSLWVESSSSEIRDTHRDRDAVEIAGQSQADGVSADLIVGSAALVWATGVVLLGIRLLGGGILAASIRRRARPVLNESAAKVASRLQADLHRPVPVSLLQSEHVEAPVVIGWLRPALILPTDVADRLTPGMIAAVLAHEFAHIERRDYVANVVQSIAELLLFFSPAVAWMSRSIREAREYCCDDAAVHRCGDPKHYVQALTTLASLATVNTVRPALGAAGPRLIARVRRLLQEEPMPRFSSMRLLSLAAMLAILVVSGLRVTAASASYASRFAATGSASPAQAAVPFGYATEQAGSGVVLGPFVWTAGVPVQRATARNLSAERITGLRFVAIVERLSFFRTAVSLFSSEVIPVSIAPGESAEVSAQVLSPAQLQQAAAASPDRVQVFFGLQAVRFANGADWHLTPNPAAATGREALAIPPAEIPRELLAKTTVVSPAADSLCRDQNGRAYSPGAIVPLRNEPGHVARCVNGRWEETTVR